MASKTITLYMDSELIMEFYAGENISEGESFSILLESDLDSAQRDIQSVPKLFAQGSWVTGARVDFRDITLKANAINLSNNVLNFRSLLDSISYDERVRLVYNDNGYVKTFNECIFTSWSFRKVGSDDEYEIELTVRSFDGL